MKNINFIADLYDCGSTGNYDAINDETEVDMCRSVRGPPLVASEFRL
jgi:hypothetical protein